jgi:flagellar basal body-associated protein FliL
MKKTVLALSLTLLLLVCGGMFLRAQDQPAPKKDTVNMDTHAKPEFYYSLEDEDAKKENNSSSTIIIVVAAAVVVVVGGVAYFMLKKKK